jgi:hypothetical protein
MEQSEIAIFVKSKKPRETTANCHFVHINLKSQLSLYLKPHNNNSASDRLSCDKA